MSPEQDKYSELNRISILFIVAWQSQPIRGRSCPKQRSPTPNSRPWLVGRLLYYLKRQSHSEVKKTKRPE